MDLFWPFSSWSRRLMKRHFVMALRSPPPPSRKRSRCDDDDGKEQEQEKKKEKEKEKENFPLRRCGSCMYFWPFCDRCVCPEPHQYCSKKHPIIRQLEQHIPPSLLEQWDQELTPEQYVKQLSTLDCSFRKKKERD